MKANRPLSMRSILQVPGIQVLRYTQKWAPSKHSKRQMAPQWPPTQY